MKLLVLFILLWPLAASADAWVAARNLPAGTVISSADIMIAPGPTADAPSVPPEALVGLATRTAIYEGRPITPEMLNRPSVVARNQVVTLVYEAGGLRIQTEGRALGAGAAGDSLRVMNLSSRTAVQARVNEDGTVTVAQP